MVPFELLHCLVRVLEDFGIPHLMTGSTATIAYAVPRFTNDIDVVVDLHLDQVQSSGGNLPRSHGKHGEVNRSTSPSVCSLASVFVFPAERGAHGRRPSRRWFVKDSSSGAGISDIRISRTAASLS